MRLPIIFFILTFFLNSCAEYNIQKNVPEKKYYNSTGFALIYDLKYFNQKIINKKINNEESHLIHRSLKKNTLVKITNPINHKSIEAKVIKNADYPKIFSVVISKKISTFLNLDINNPFIEILEIKKNKTFIAKEGAIFDEEKNVAEKAPVSEVLVDDIAKEKKLNTIKKKKKYNFIILISDFYYEESATKLQNELNIKMEKKTILLKKINNKKYRLYAGPFKNFNALKKTYISLNQLGFDDLNVYKE